MRSTARSPKAALLLGFGGVIFLLTILGLDMLRVLAEMQSANETIRRDFFVRERQLTDIRSALYLSGTYVRDYLLDPNPEAAERHRTSLLQVRKTVTDEVAAYEKLIRTEQRGPFHAFEQELRAYWKSLAPVFVWSPYERRRNGYAFVRDEVLPRRTSMLSMADRIGEVNEQDLSARDRRVADLYIGFRRRVVVILLVAIALALLEAVATIRVILYLQKKTTEQFAQLSEARTQLRDLSARLVKAQEAERKAISRELHDAVGQSLSAVLLELKNLGAKLPRDIAAVHAHAATIKTLVENSVAMVRNITLLLRPSMLDDLGLAPAIEWQARETSKRTGILVNVTAEDIPDDLADDHKTCIFRLVQEALNNVSKHAGAQTVRVAVQSTLDALIVAIQDDGAGFDITRNKGLGLLGIQERVEQLGGVVRVDSGPGRGTLVTATLPVADRSAGTEG